MVGPFPHDRVLALIVWKADGKEMKQTLERSHCQDIAYARDHVHLGVVGKGRGP